MISPETKILALIGNPVKHSLSPRIQNCFIRKYSVDAVYVAFKFNKNYLKEAFTGAKKLGFMGLNVTMPYKNEVFNLVDRNDSISKSTKSVNTVKFDSKSGISIGFNTDVGGFTKSMDKKNFNWKDSNCLVIGAGGAARSVIIGLILKKVKKIWVYNRTREKIDEIKEIFKEEGITIDALDDINKLDSQMDKINLIVNCTPMGMYMESFRNLMPVPESWDLNGKIVFDAVYNPVETLLVKKARKDGAGVVSGIDMLINQAALSFESWFGIMPADDYIEEIKRDVLIDMTKIN
ncbi:MAG: shikimate dehydrogenase [Actinomycetota bacterium]|nr:shikimate dehydrogenase [Actinomycetota bacterium]